MSCRLLAAISALCLCVGAPAAAQDDVAAFYRGKQLRFIVGSAAGGGYDLFARIVARHINSHPGNPIVIVEPDCRGVVIINQLYAQVPRTAPWSAS
jgi:tripartite-type tricarboxylate transporter receptor subunit TctC